MKTVIQSREDSVLKAAEQIKSLLVDKPDAVIALAFDDGIRELCVELSAMYRRGELSFNKAHFFTLCELTLTEPCRRLIIETLLNTTDAREENCFFLNDANVDKADESIAALGGLDLAIPNIGSNARIGFNEPATPFQSRSHAQKLAPATRRELAESFGGADSVPEYGLTMGINTICSAKEIMLLAFGDGKAEPVFKMLYGRNDSAVPAAFLQIPVNVAVYLDEAAAKKL